MLIGVKNMDLYYIISFGGRGGGRELVDFYDGGDHVNPFSQTPKYVDQIFQRPQNVD